MEYICKTIEYPLYTSRAFQLYFQDMDIGILDIETTGLSPKNSAFILGGLVTPGCSGLKTEQFFAGSLPEEQEALASFWKAVSEKDVLITFNGQHFDLPFMKARAPEIIKRFPFHLDLYLMVKNFSPIRKFLPNLKQKSIENYMGLWQYRKDEISGKESVDLYYRFLSEKRNELKELILLHNHDDILQLYRLLKVLEKTEIHKAMFCSGFPVKSGSSLFIIENIKVTSDQLIFSGYQYHDPLQYQAYEHNGILCHIDFNKTKQNFSVHLPLMQQAGMTLLDLEALDFLPDDLQKYPACQEGFLILGNQGELNYLEINHFIKLFVERITNQWITNR